MPHATISMQLVEARRGKPLTEVLVDLYDQHRNLAGVAESLHMTRQNLWLWMVRLEIDSSYLRARVRLLDRKRAAKKAEHP